MWDHTTGYLPDVGRLTNPLMRTQFVTVYTLNGVIMLPSINASWNLFRAPFNHPSASWRRMLIVQPICTWMVVTNETQMSVLTVVVCPGRYYDASACRNHT